MADRFREYLRGVENNETDASKPVAAHHNMAIRGLIQSWIASIDGLDIFDQESIFTD